MEYQHIRHEFDPVYDRNSEILILGTLPSVKSREQRFYYGHKQNRFWKVIAALYGEAVPVTIEEKKKILLRHHIALFNVVPTDLSVILKQAPVRKIFANGNKAYDLYMKYSYEKTGMEAGRLPSTSPANAAYQMERLLQSWKVILR